MILVLFEVTIKKDCMQSYRAMSGKVKAELEKAKGFIRSERFVSLANERTLFSVSVWENEEAVNEWRNQHDHRQGQRQGRDSMFESYTVTVASPLRSYTDQERQDAPEDSNAVLIDNG